MSTHAWRLTDFFAPESVVNVEINRTTGTTLSRSAFSSVAAAIGT